MIAWKLNPGKPMKPPTQPKTPLASATSATNASTIAPTATARRTPVCAPSLAAMMMLAARSLWRSTPSSGSLRGPGGSGMMILAMAMPPGADMNAAATNQSMRMPIAA